MFKTIICLPCLPQRMFSLALIVSMTLVTACSSLQTQPEAAPEAKGMTLDEDMLYELLVAEFAGNAGDLATSANFYQRAAQNSDDSRIAARATYIALYGKEYEIALKLLDRWRELEPESQDIDRMYAICYLRLRQPERALPYVQAVLATENSSNQEKAMAVKQLLSDEVAAEDSLALLDGLNQAQTDNPQMLILQARYAAELEQFEKSIELLDRVLEIDHAMIDVHLIKARIYQAQGNREAARSVMLDALKARPDNWGLRLQYAQMLVEDKQYDEAREQYALLQQQQPDNAEVLLNLSLLNIETDRFDEATISLQSLLELDQHTDVAHFYLGRIEQNREQYKKAIAHYIKVKNGRYVFEAKLRIASLFAKLDRVDDAIEQLEILAEETEEWSDRVRAYLAQGEIYRSRQRYQETFDMYTQALRQKPEDINLLYARALVAEKVDRVDIAESDLLKVLSIDPENADALNALGYTLADKTKRYQEAKEYIQKAMSLLPDDPAVMDSLGWVNYRLGEMQEALKWLSQAFARVVDPEIAAHYGEVLWQTNQKDKARDIWRKGQEVDAQHPILLETMKRLQP